MTEELQKKAEDFIIDRYKIAECYREDNTETREYMRMDVHSQYEEEYQLYLNATKELEKENAELKKQLKMSNKVYNDNLDYSHHIEGQLTKAKELLKQWIELYKPKLEGYPITPIQEQTEQFLNSEVEK